MVSDALRCSGMPEGEYELGGQKIFLENDAVVAKLSDGTVAGSVSNLYKGMQNVIHFGIREEDAVRAATWNPACAIGKEAQIGSIETGKLADFLVCSSDYSEKRVFLGGKELI